MKVIKFTTDYEKVLRITDKDFKTKYETVVGDNKSYTKVVDGEQKHFAICPKCNNPVSILGIYKKIDTTPHARHAKWTDLPGIVNYNNEKYLNCPYHRKNANYVKEYVEETEEPERRKLYQITKEHYDKVIYMLQKQTGIHITLKLAKELAENYAAFRVYNYKDATIYNIPWYLIHSYASIPLYHMIIEKDSTIYRRLKGFKDLDIELKDSKINGCVYVANNKGYQIKPTDYRYSVGEDDELNEWLDFSIIEPDEKVTSARLYKKADRFNVKVDSYHFANLIEYKGWRSNQKLLDIAAKYMNP